MRKRATGHPKIHLNFPLPDQKRKFSNIFYDNTVIRLIDQVGAGISQVGQVQRQYPVRIRQSLAIQASRKGDSNRFIAVNPETRAGGFTHIFGKQERFTLWRDDLRASRLRIFLPGDRRPVLSLRLEIHRMDFAR